MDKAGAELHYQFDDSFLAGFNLGANTGSNILSLLKRDSCCKAFFNKLRDQIGNEKLAVAH